MKVYATTIENGFRRIDPGRGKAKEGDGRVFANHSTGASHRGRPAFRFADGRARSPVVRGKANELTKVKTQTSTKTYGRVEV